MALVGKIIGYTELRSGGKLILDILRYQPHDLASMLPDKIHSFDLLSGRLGAVGSTIFWEFTHEGKKLTSKEIIEEIDESNNKIVFKMVGGEIVEIYKAFTTTFHCETIDGKEMGVVTLEFERPNTSVPYPTSLMDYLFSLLKDLDDHNTRP
uniref:kirola-like n=1 Tax=Erigeron canadensis TaxID=72917 RepID=UPI001CB8E7C1|nr:kirola-like [Erigeron canadensis]